MNFISRLESYTQIFRTIQIRKMHDIYFLPIFLYSYSFKFTFSIEIIVFYKCQIIRAGFIGLDVLK